MTIGAEYYAPEFLLPFNKLVASPFAKESLEFCCPFITDGDHGSAEYADEGVPFILSEAIEEGRIRREACRFLMPKYAESLERSKLQVGDVLVTKTGVYFGISAVVDDSFVGANTIAHVGILRPRPGLDPYFLSTFLNSRYGQVQLRRRGIKTSRPEIKLLEFADIQIPICTGYFQTSIRDKILEALNTFKAIERKFTDAEHTLLHALGLENWHPPEPLTYIRSATEALAAKRLDSDFFSPARYATLDKLAAMPHRLLGEYCDCIRDLLDPTDVQEVGLVRNYDVTDALRPTLEDSKKVVEVGELGSTKKIMRPGDVVISRLRSYLRQIAVVRTSDSIPTVGSTEFIVLRPRNGISPELLMVFLRSKPVQTILRYCQEGNQHPRFGEANLLEIPFPELLFPHGEEIVSQVRQAHAARQQAEELLAKAKRAVEIAIEDGEDKGMAFLNA